MQTNNVPYLDHLSLVERYREYAYPQLKISQLVRSGKLIKVRRGLYLDSQDTTYSMKTLANMICSPSYLSFEYALRFYQMIPEHVVIYTSASFNKNKNKTFHTPIGTFEYYYLNPSVYPFGITRLEEKGQPFLIATKEKAILDTLSKIGSVRSVKALNALLFEDLRIDEDELKDLNRHEIEFLSVKYHQRNCHLFAQWLESRKE